MSRGAMGFATIRFRIAAIAALVVAVVLMIVAVVLLALLRDQLFTNLDNSLALRSDTYETAFVEDRADNFSILLNSNEGDRAAQLVSPGGEVVASTPNLADSGPLGRTAGRNSPSVRSTSVADLDDDAFRILTRDVETASGPAVLHVVQNIDDLNDTIRNLTAALAIAVPVVVAILGALVWWLVGRTLAPVEFIRAEVDDISGTDLQRRLPVPPQGDEISRLATTMNRLLDRIDAAGRRQRQFVADASHELRTPLTRMRTELEVDLEQPELADQGATQALVLEETVGLQAMLDDLLFLARSDEDQQRSTTELREWTDFDDVVFREAERQRAGTTLAIDTSGISAAYLRGDQGQLRRVVRNLLSNALRHGESAITVTLAEDDDWIRLVVADDGPGVPKASHEHIFERFGRVDDARARNVGGTGLGLAIVRDIVERHGGVVACENGAAGGARFIVDLPTRRSVS